jgi:hypothetical protein
MMPTICNTLLLIYKYLLLMIDANHTLAYPLAKRLEGRANGISIKRIDDKNGI